MWPFKRRRTAISSSTRTSSFSAEATSDRPRGFGYKTTWWAILSTDTIAVAEAIGLINPKACNWATGIPASYKDGVFVTPPIEGWTLVTSVKLPPNGSEIESECLSSLLKLSSQFHDAQVFSTHRVVGYCVWGRALNGELDRGYGYLGETGQILWDAGDESMESSLGLSFAHAAELEAGFEESDDFDWPNEDHVMEIAGEWSVSPVELDEFESTGSGLLGFDAKLVTNQIQSGVKPPQSRST